MRLVELTGVEPGITSTARRPCDYLLCVTSIDPAHDPRGAAWEQRLRRPVIAAAIGALPAVGLYVVAEGGWMAVTAVILSWVVWLVFAAEAAIMLSVTRDKLAWARGHWLSLVIVAASFPLLVELAKGLLAARAVNTAFAVRLLQALYFVKLAKVAKSIWVLHRKLDGRRARLAVGGASLAAVPIGYLLIARAL